jgi:hypothetical protein
MGDSIGFLLVIPVLAIIAAAFHYWFHNRILRYSYSDVCGYIYIASN